MIGDPGHQALTQSARGPFRMIGQETHFLLIARPEVPVQFVRVFEVIAEHLIDVRQRESGKLLDDLFSSGAMVERVKNNVERDAGSANAVNAVRVFRQRNFFQNRRQGSAETVDSSTLRDSAISARRAAPNRSDRSA